MSKITKEQVLENLDEVKKYIQEVENKKEEKTIGIAIKSRWTGEIIFQSTKTTWKEAVEEGKADLYEADLGGADLGGANLSGADLRGADLCVADLMNAKFSGKSGTTKIKKSGLDDFLKALGIVVEN